MLIAMINELVDLENNKEEVEKVLMQLLEQDKYNALCNKLENFLIDKRSELLKAKGASSNEG